jgi:UDP-galactopyranose mutase
MEYNVVIVGAGWSGAVMADRLVKELGYKVLVIEQRWHIGGNSHDYVNDNGIRVHTYGPHLFHTEFEDVWQYLSQYTNWHIYEHTVQANIDGRLVPIPFNFNTIKALFPEAYAHRLIEKLLEKYPFGARIPILEMLREDDKDLKFLADFVYQKMFVNYTAKQWGVSPTSIDPAVTGRVPIVLSNDNRYFPDKYQALPEKGYTAIFEKLLHQDNITLMMGTDYREVLQIDKGGFTLFGKPFSGKVIYTGMIDVLFNKCFGDLPYRSLHFDERHENMDLFQPVSVVNYPNQFEFTRITEYKHLMGNPPKDKTTVYIEYPGDYKEGDARYGTPYYPVFKDENKARYEEYKKLVGDIKGLHLLGRLADYKYYDQDDAIKNALDYDINLFR